jgi:hypothetical protein
LCQLGFRLRWVLRQLSAAAQAADAELEGARARLATVDAEHVCAFGSA